MVFMQHANLIKFSCIYNRFLFAVHYQRFRVLALKNVAESVKIFPKSVAGFGKSCTFALPFEKRVADEAERVLIKTDAKNRN